MTKSRELIISPKVSRGQLGKFLAEIAKEGIKIVNADPQSLRGIKTRLSTIHSSQSANYVIVAKPTKYKNKKVGMRFKVLSNNDIENVLKFSKMGLDFVIVRSAILGM